MPKIKPTYSEIKIPIVGYVTAYVNNEDVDKSYDKVVSIIKEHGINHSNLLVDVQAVQKFQAKPLKNNIRISPGYAIDLNAEEEHIKTHLINL